MADPPPKSSSATSKHENISALLSAVQSLSERVHDLALQFAGLEKCDCQAPQRRNVRKKKWLNLCWYTIVKMISNEGWTLLNFNFTLFYISCPSLNSVSIFVKCTPIYFSLNIRLSYFLLFLSYVQGLHILNAVLWKSRTVLTTWCVKVERVHDVVHLQLIWDREYG